jgi:Ni,Fe-hydrogenase I small subunit
MSDSETIFGLNLRPSSKYSSQQVIKAESILDVKKPTLLLETNEQTTAHLSWLRCVACTSNLAKFISSKMSSITKGLTSPMSRYSEYF